jgi:hypothetical protein
VEGEAAEAEIGEDEVVVPVYLDPEPKLSRNTHVFGPSS